jgi:hypothetical protein
MTIRKGTRVRSHGVIPWPHGKVREGTVSGVIQNSTPFGDRDADTYWVDWDRFQPSGPYWASDFTIIG